MAIERPEPPPGGNGSENSARSLESNTRTVSSLPSERTYMPQEQAETVDYYEALELQATATPSEIKSSYLRLVRQFTPESAPARFRIISAAYQTLANPKKRKAYDTEERLPEEVRDQMSRLMRAAIEEESSTALDELEDLSNEHSSSKVIRFALGVTLDRRGRHHKAVGVFEHLFKEDPTNAEYATWLGDALLSSGDERAGVQKLKEAVVLDKDCTIAYVCLAKHYTANDEEDRALQILNRGIHADGVVDIQDLPLFIERILILARSSKWAQLEDVATELCSAVSNDDLETRQYASSQLAPLVQLFISADRADLTHFVLETMRKLDPSNNEIAEFSRDITESAASQRNRPAFYDDKKVPDWIKALVAFWSADDVPDDVDRFAAGVAAHISQQRDPNAQWQRAQSRHPAALRPFSGRWKETFGGRSSHGSSRRPSSTGPDTTCPCGSGRKYKNCCGVNRGPGAPSGSRNHQPPAGSGCAVFLAIAGTLMYLL